MTAPETVVLPRRAIEQLAMVLDHCHAFLDDNSGVQAQLREYCLPQPYEVTTFWVIDRLAWHALLLRVHLDEQAEQAEQDGGGDRRG